MSRRALAILVGPLAVVAAVAVLAPAPPSDAPYCEAAESARFELRILFEGAAWMDAAERLLDEIPLVLEETPSDLEDDWRLVLRGVRAIVDGGLPRGGFEPAVERINADFDDRCALAMLEEESP